MDINDKTEKQVYDISTKHFKCEFKLYRKPVQQLQNIRRDYSSFIVHQSPFENLAHEYQWSDFSMYNEVHGFDARIEVASLTPNSILRDRVLKTIADFEESGIEEELDLILLGDGFNNVEHYINHYAPNCNVQVFRSLDRFRKYLEYRFTF